MTPTILLQNFCGMHSHQVGLSARVTISACDSHLSVSAPSFHLGSYLNGLSTKHFLPLRAYT